MTFVSDGETNAYKAVCKGRGPYDKSSKGRMYKCGETNGDSLEESKTGKFHEKETETGKKFRQCVLGGANMLTEEVIKLILFKSHKGHHKYKL